MEKTYNIDIVTVNKCCAICENNRSKDNCIMTKIYEAGENLGYSDEVYIATFNMRCKDFVLNNQFQNQIDKDKINIRETTFGPRNLDC